MTRSARFATALLSLCAVALAQHVGTQRGTMASAVKDATAIPIIEAALAASGIQQTPTDAVLVGILMQAASGRTANVPIVFKCKGSQLAKIEVQQPKGMTVSIINRGRGVLERPDGTVIDLLSNNTMIARAEYIPVFSLLAEYQDSGMSVENQGTAQVLGHTATIVALRPLPNPNVTQALLGKYVSKTKFYVDQSTNLVVKIERTNFAANDTSFGQKIEIYLSDYRFVNGVLVPFKQTEFHDGQLDSDLIVRSVTLNTGLSDSEFSLPEAK